MMNMTEKSEKRTFGFLEFIPRKVVGHGLKQEEMRY